MRKTFTKKHTQAKLDNLLGIDNSNTYHIPLYDNFESFKKDYTINLKEYLKYNPTETEHSFIGENLIYKYNKYKANPLDYKFTLSERKYGTFIDVEFDIQSLISVLTQAVENYILRCYKRKSFLLSIQWDEVVTYQGNKAEIHYKNLTTELLRILLKRMLNVNTELLLIDLSRVFLQNYSYIERNSVKFDFIGFIENEYIENHKIAKFLLKRAENLKSFTKNVNTFKFKYTNPQKLALLHVLGFFDLPVFATLTETKINELTGLLLEADPKEFVYKNRLNLKSKSPHYQTDKYTSYQYLDEMKKLISDTD